jgi:type IV fimbrial biogenesis protein FimT
MCVAHLPRHPHGFTVWELATVMAVVAILLAAGTPGFVRLSAAAGVTSNADRLMGAMHFARSQAILTGRPFVVCLSGDLASCVGRGAQSGRAWIVFENARAEFSPVRDADEPILRQHQLDRPTRIHASRGAVTFWPTSRAGSTSTFEVCSEVPGVASRAVIVSQTGRPRLRLGLPRGAATRCNM